MKAMLPGALFIGFTGTPLGGNGKSRFPGYLFRKIKR
jgi:type I site-specific restriction-modification system R (restriction) subunit